LGDHLAKKFSQREIFMDVDALKPGLDFAKQIDEQVSNCDVFLALIGPSWLNAVDEKGRRKLDLPQDYVRVELASALKREIPVIPVLINGAAMPSEDDLPEDLKSLSSRHALELRLTRFAADSKAIIQALNVILPRPKWRRISVGAGLVVACVLAGILLWSVQNERYPFGLSNIFQTKPPAKLAVSQEIRAGAPNDSQQQSKLRQPPTELCESCHSLAGTTKQPNKEVYAGGLNLAGSQHADQGVLCVDCHMGAVPQRKTKTLAGDAAWDVSFHGTSSPVSKRVDVPGSCGVCHTDQRLMANGTKPPLKTGQELLDYVRKIQDSTKSSITKIQSRAETNKNKDKDSQTLLQLNNAQANLDIILLDGSLGVHNSRVSANGVVSLQGAIAECLRLANVWVELACRKPGANCTGDVYYPINGPITEPTSPVCLAP
jgi:hypothetical protein